MQHRSVARNVHRVYISNSETLDQFIYLGNDGGVQSRDRIFSAVIDSSHNISAEGSLRICRGQNPDRFFVVKRDQRKGKRRGTDVKGEAEIFC